MSLTTYKSKRDFSKTSEPEGRVEKSKNKSFVVQYHKARRDHFDFRLEHNGVLLSWAVPKGPSFNPKDKRLAVHVEDHPLEYANFEGNIPKGEYGAGSVIIWDRGTYRPIESFDKALKKGALKFELFGERLKGVWALVKMDKKNWLLVKDRDKYAKKTSGIKSLTSVITKKNSQQKLQTSLPKKISPMLARLCENIPNNDDWVFEIKYDGFRILARCENKRAQLLSRNGVDYTGKFSEIAASIKKLSKFSPFVLDGEIILPDDAGKSDFSLLQSYLKGKKVGQPVYVVFDILFKEEEDLRTRAYLERKKILKSLLSRADKNIVYCQHVVGDGKKCLEAAEKLGLEGIVAKRKDSHYLGSRNGDWLKIKCRKRQEFIVCGYTEKDKFSSLLLGAYEGKELKYFGKVGTGFGIKEGEELKRRFNSFISKTNPFKTKFSEAVTFLKPHFVAEIEYAELSSSGLLRQASFKGLRQDKSPKDVILEKANPSVLGLEITHPDRVIFHAKNVTKLDLANYYLAASERMLPLISNRLLSVVRMDETGETFYKKHPSSKQAGIKIKSVKNSDGEKSDYFCVTSPEGIIREVQNGSVEFHTWASRAEKLEKPNLMTFDLDPDEGLDLSAVRQGVRDLKKVLSSLSLVSFLKTSGGKGYHVVVPLPEGCSWQKFSDFAKRVAQIMEQKWPDRYTSNMRKIERKSKIFIDWVRNGRGATSVAPYSVRARKNASVSMPISWSQLNKIAPDGIDIKKAEKLLKKPDPWQGFFEVDQRLT